MGTNLIGTGELNITLVPSVDYQYGPSGISCLYFDYNSTTSLSSNSSTIPSLSESYGYKIDVTSAFSIFSAVFTALLM